MIQLKDFVAESLKQVIEGISAAQIYATDKHAAVNPAGIYHKGDGQYRVDKRSPQDHEPIPEIFEFDIAITASEGSEAKGGIGVFAGTFALGTQAKAEDTNETVSRIKFSVPVLFPQQ